MKLIADAVLGRLATSLRFLGFDVYARGLADRQLILAAQLKGRTVLTRDRGFLGRKKMNAPLIVIESDDWPRRLMQLRVALDLDGPTRPPRCPSRNSALSEAEKDGRLRGQVPEFVYHSVDVFSSCTGCGGACGEGSHCRLFHAMTTAACRG
ncbi:MAG: hypothetical protein OHK006_19500 [Thermodesulfovibrionales bacterium]